MKKIYLLLSLLLCMSIQLIAQDQANFTFSMEPTTGKVIFTNTSQLVGTGDRKAIWDFGDGQKASTSWNAGIQHVYRSGTYEACLRIYKFTSSSDSVLTGQMCKQIKIEEVCTAGISFKDSISYSPFAHHVTFRAEASTTGSKVIKKVCWKFGDGTEKCTEATPGTSGEALLITTHTYGPSSTPLVTYNACVTITFDGGCVAEKCISVYLQYPTTEQCAVDIQKTGFNSSTTGFIFTAVPSHSTGKKPLQVCWKIGNSADTICRTYASTFTGTYSIEKQFNTPGTYEVCTWVKYDGGCEAKKCITLTIPGTTTNTCTTGLAVLSTASNSSTKSLVAIRDSSSNNKPVQVCWKFGDGTPDVCKTYATTYTGTYTLEHTYQKPGQYEACVVMKYDGGCESRKCALVTIAETQTPCKAAIRFAPSISNVLVQHVFAVPDSGKVPVYICWKFGDGSETVCKQYANTYTGTYSVEHKYPNAGSYEACVRIVYANGCESTQCGVLSIPRTSDSCTATIKIEATLTNPLGKHIIARPATDRKPVEICWKFGDGSPDVCKTYAATYTGTYSVEHQYPSAGQYPACVEIKYDGGCSARSCETVKIETQTTCEVKLQEVAAAFNALERKFYLGLNTNSRPEKICWKFGDGSADTCITVPNPMTQDALIIGHKFPAPGLYKVCVRVQFAGGCVAERCMEVNIRPLTNTSCGGYVNVNQTDEKTFAFTAFSIAASNDQAISYTWTFGDGSTATGKEVKHTYATSGVYQVCAVIRTATGCETRICQKVMTGGDTRPQLILTPNPVTTNLHAQFFSSRAETVAVRLYNGNGLLLRSFSKAAVAGENNWDFEVGTLPIGVYSLVVQSNYQFANAIFFKQ